MLDKMKKIKKGGIDTIVAYVVVMLPLLYVLIFMVATIYHFTIQMYLNQVVKEALVMASTYGGITTEMQNYMSGKLDSVFEANDEGNSAEFIYYIREFDEASGTMGEPEMCTESVDAISVRKADILGIFAKSTKPSLLSKVNAFSIFGSDQNAEDLYYSAYREEIIRNEPPN